jgi:hypothetical protein
MVTVGPPFSSESDWFETAYRYTERYTQDTWQESNRKNTFMLEIQSSKAPVESI